MKKIAIIGQGYVGLPLALAFAEANISVIALDIDVLKIGQLQNGISYIRHIPTSRVESAVRSGFLQPTTSFEQIKEAEATLICVPTPLDEHRQPDMSFVCDTGRSIAPHLQQGCLVILESTTYPGTTEDLLKPLLEAGSGLSAGTGFHLAFSPEREDPANPHSQLRVIPKLIGGHTLKCRDKAVQLYSHIVDHPVPVASCKVAEAAKLTENIFRSVNIALVNELKIIFDKMGIDIWEVIEASKTKPFGYMPFYPGPGLGGHCIPIDPFYLSWKAKETGTATRFIELAGEINQAMPDYVIDRLTEALNESGQPIKDRHILVVGMAYKKNVDDMRESPALRTLDLIRKKHGIPGYFDPYIPEIPKTREYPHWQGLRTEQWTPEALGKYTAAIIVTAHDGIDYAPLLNSVPTIIDTRNALIDLPSQTKQVWKA